MEQRYLDQDESEDYMGNVSVVCPHWAPVVGFFGIACAVVFASE
jgi:hypothetical protein